MSLTYGKDTQIILEPCNDYINLVYDSISNALHASVGLFYFENKLNNSILSKKKSASE